MKKKGSVLLIVVIVMMITFVLAAFIVDISNKSNRVNFDTFNRTKAYYSAEAGIYDFINYANSKNCDLNSKTSVVNLYNNGGLYGDNMAVYKAILMDAVTTTQTGNSKTCNFNIYSTGSYSSQTCIIVANVSIIYVKDGNGGYKYSSYSINSKKVYKG